MEDPQMVCFGPFRLELLHEQLWRQDRSIPLRPKTLAVLRHLVTHPGQLVTKNELLDVVWEKTIVSDTVLRSCIRELRTLLRDDVQQPRYIATVHRRGYRFIETVVSGQSSVVSCEDLPGIRSPTSEVRSSRPLIPGPQHPVPVFVGRETELAQMHGWLDKALNGERQVVFVTGEAGIGKT